MSTPAVSVGDWLARSARRAMAERVGLSPRQWRQLEQLVDGGGAWLPPTATLAPGACASHSLSVAGLLILCSQGLAESDPSPANDQSRWRATGAGEALVAKSRA